jgi:hypothetical protein
MTKIIINRASEYSNKLRDIKILLNDKEIGKIKDGESKTFPIQPGKYQLIAKVDWCSSNEITLNINEGEVKRFSLNGTSSFLALYYITFGRNKYLNLLEIK